MIRTWVRLGFNGVGLRRAAGFSDARGSTGETGGSSTPVGGGAAASDLARSICREDAAGFFSAGCAAGAAALGVSSELIGSGVASEAAAGAGLGLLGLIPPHAAQRMPRSV